MLVFSRMERESFVFVVGGQVIATTTVTKVRGKRTRVGVEALDHVRILRTEVWEQLQAEAEGIGDGETNDQKSRPVDAGRIGSRLAGSNQGENGGRLETGGLQS